MTFNFVQEEFNIGGAGQVPPALQFYKRGFVLGGSVSPTWKDIILSGNTALTLVNSKANGLNYVKLFGKCEQNGTPSPENPIDIVCNNGVLKVSKNLFDKSLEVQGYYLAPSNGEPTINPDSAYVRYISVNPSTEYTLSFVYKKSGYFARVHGYNSGKVWTSLLWEQEKNSGALNDVITKTFITGANDYYLGISYPKLDEDIQLEQGDTVTSYLPYGKIYTDGTTETVTVTGKNLFDINNILLQGRAYTLEKSGNNIVATANAGTSSASRIEFFIPVSMFKENTTYYLSTKSDVTLTGARCNIGKATPQATADNAYYTTIRTQENGGWSGAFTITDIAEGQDYVSFFYYLGEQDEGTVITISDIMISEGSTATAYEPYFNGGTANAEILLSVDNYKDVQSVIDGAVTRNVGIKVLDGTEDWFAYNGGAGYRTTVQDMMSSTDGAYFCTHAISVSSVTSKGIRFGASNKVLYWCQINTTFTTSDIFKAWLAEQYANGTPVIVVFPLAEPITESVTPQPLTIQEGTNIITAEGSIENLPLEVSYKAGVAVTVTEVENTQLDNNVEVTING